MSSGDCTSGCGPRSPDSRALRRLYEDIERPLVRVLLDMEHTGVLIDAEMLRRQSHEIAKSLIGLEQAAHAAAGTSFNLDSPKQLQEVLFGKLALPVKRRTATGQPSTAEDVLEELALEFELPRIIMEYRALAKLKSTYTDKLPAQRQPAHRSRPHLLPPGGGRHRSALIDRPEPAEHPDPHAGGPAHPAGLRRAARAT